MNLGTWLLGGVLLLCMRADAFGCTEAACLGGGVEVQSNFVVAITYRDRALAGVKVEVTSGSRQSAKMWSSGRTNGQGLAHITALPAGEYWIATDFLGVSAGEYCFHIPSKPEHAISRLDFDWGEWAIAAKAIAGNLTVYRPGPGANGIQKLLHQTKQTAADIPMTLTNIKTSETYQFTSGSDGSFAFPSALAGTYVLHIGSSESVQQNGIGESYEVVELSTDGNRNYLSFVARPSNCPGLYFSLEP